MANEYLRRAGLYGYATSQGSNLGEFLKNARTYSRPGTTGRPDLMLNDWIRLAPMLIPQYLEQSPEAQTLFSGEGYEDLVRPQIRSLLTGIRTTAAQTQGALGARGFGRSTLAARVNSDLLAKGNEGVAALLAQARLQRFAQAVALRQNIAQLQANLTLGSVGAMHRPKPHGRSFWKSLGRGAISTFTGSLMGSLGGFLGSLGTGNGATYGDAASSGGWNGPFMGVSSGGGLPGGAQGLGLALF